MYGWHIAPPNVVVKFSLAFFRRLLRIRFHGATNAGRGVKTNGRTYEIVSAKAAECVQKPCIGPLNKKLPGGKPRGGKKGYVKFEVETGASPGWSPMVIYKGALVNIWLKG